MNKIALGTVQFGLNYGINNTRGQIAVGEVGEILTLASAKGINTLDTAYDYGTSEEVIGSFQHSRREPFHVITKLPQCNAQQAGEFLKASLSRLKIASVQGLLVHHFQSFKQDAQLLEELVGFKKTGKVKQYGFSLYFTQDLEELLAKKIPFDIVQVPVSVFDQRFISYFPELRKRGIDIHVRSVFLQGLMFKQPREMVGPFAGLRAKLEHLHELAVKTAAPVWALGLNAVLMELLIDKVILGVDSLEHLKLLLQAQQYVAQTQHVMPQLKNLREDDEQIILPMNWKK